MDQLFAIETKAFISKSREVAIDMGYNYISTLHFFFASCEETSAFPLLHFAFKNKDEYEIFKSAYRQNRIDYLNFVDESIPLTKEAEVAIKEGLIEQKNFQQQLTFPWHILIAAVKNKKSILSECFKNDPDVDEKIINYYRQKGAFDIHKINDENELNSGNSIIQRLKRYLKFRN